MNGPITMFIALAVLALALAGFAIYYFWHRRKQQREEAARYKQKLDKWAEEGYEVTEFKHRWGNYLAWASSRTGLPSAPYLLIVALLVVGCLGGWTAAGGEFPPWRSISRLTIEVDPHGSGKVEPDRGTYEKGSEVELRAEPSSGYRFDHWTGDVSGTSPSVTLTMNSDKTVTASFIRVYELTSSSEPEEGGRVTPAKGTYEKGQQVTLKAEPSPGYRFEHWSGDVSGSSQQMSITLNSDKGVVAHFIPETYPLTKRVQPSEGGSISANPAPGRDGKYAYDTVVELSATHTSGYKFDHWVGTDDTSANPTTVTMTGDTAVTAIMKAKAPDASFVGTPVSGEKPLKVNFTDQSAGKITNSSWDFGDGHKSDAQNPSHTYTTAGTYTVSLTVSGPGGSDTMTRSNYVSVSVPQYSLKTEVEPAGSGSVTPGSGTYPEGEHVILHAKPSLGYRFSHWSGDVSGSNSETSLTMNSDKSMVAHFVRERYELTKAVEPSEGGSISANPAPGRDGKYAYGRDVELTAEAASWWKFDHWSGDADGAEKTTTITMNSDKSVTAHFKKSFQRIKLELPGSPLFSFWPHSIEFKRYMEAGEEVTGSVQWDHEWHWTLQVRDPEDNLIRNYKPEAANFHFSFRAAHNGGYKIRMDNRQVTSDHYGVMEVVPRGWVKVD